VPPTPAAAAPPPKKSTSREMRDIAAGAAPHGERKSKDGVKSVVAEEKEKEEVDEDEEGEVMEYDLADAAIVNKILKRNKKKPDSKKPAQKRKAGGEPRKKTSVVHVVFEATEVAGVFKCRVSHLQWKQGHPNVVKSKGGVTSNLLSHVKTWHPDLCNVLVKASNDDKDVEHEFQSFLKDNKPAKTPDSGIGPFVNRIKRGGTGFEKELALLIMIVGCSLPFSVIDSKPFKDWMTVLGAAMPSEGTIMKLLEPLHESVLTEQEVFVRKCGFFSITFDMWTSIAKQKYLVGTYHTMDDDFNLFSAPLDLIPVSCSGYGEFIALSLQHRIAKHKFDDCVFMASFSDSGSNCELAKGMLTPGDEEPCFHHR
jgi:hypothetical protein